jgi:hypothetical protein
MDESQPKQDHLLDTTDCLEAVGVLRGWKNFLFLVIVVCLLLLQVLFWVVNFELVKADGETVDSEQVDTPAPAAVDESANEGAKIETIPIKVADDTNEIEQAAGQVAADANVANEQAQPKGRLVPAIKFRHLAWLIRLFDFVLLLAAMLYCLTMLFTLKVSLLGRLGGINHICRAFFLSLLALVLLFPWQRFFFFSDLLAGAIYSPYELPAWIKWCADHEYRIFAAIAYYFRFTGYWLLVTLLLVFAQIRSGRWTKATLRRLEII